jgi:hypothetical protein
LQPSWEPNPARLANLRLLRIGALRKVALIAS